jgi:cytochrome b subunit of formate dehydrogenase
MARKLTARFYVTFLFVLVFALFVPKAALGADTEGCLVCHGQPGFNTIIQGKTVSLFVDADKYAAGKHADRKCSDCHTGFKAGALNSAEGPHTANQLANYNKEAIAACQKCHDKAYSQFMNGPHGKAYRSGVANAPKCTKCHETHYTTSYKDDTSPLNRLNHPTQTCKPCHEEAFNTYIENYHGKTLVTLGYASSAGCTQCHGAHTANPLTTESAKIAACSQCHKGASANFVGYNAHADDANGKAFPLLFYVKWTMTILLVLVLAFFYLHSLLWAIKDIGVMRAKRKTAAEGGEVMAAEEHEEHEEPEEYRRFNWFHISMHYTMMFTFMALVFTGMPLRYRGAAWAKAMMTTFGGVHSAGIIHRIAAGFTLGYFIAEVVYGVIYCYIVKKVPIFGPDSMFPRWKDIKDLGNNMKYFVGRGPQPVFDRFTYWEKFDYLAVFWGMFAIGATGLLLWFPEFFGKFVPGIVFNVSTIMHSDEAVLAAGFIFIVHWFNTHWRPGKFPLDPVIFTGRISKHELMEERPLEWARMQQDQKLKERMRIEEED